MVLSHIMVQSHRGEQIFFCVNQPAFIYLGFYINFNTVQVISQLVVLSAEKTSTYSWYQGSVL